MEVRESEPLYSRNPFAPRRSLTVELLPEVEEGSLRHREMKLFPVTAEECAPVEALQTPDMHIAAPSESTLTEEILPHFPSQMKASTFPAKLFHFSC